MVKDVFHKKMFLVKGGYPASSRYRNSQCMDRMASKREVHKKRNGQLLSLVPKKINPELIHLKIILSLWFVMIYHLGLQKGRAIAKGIIDKVSS